MVGVTVVHLVEHWEVLSAECLEKTSVAQTDDMKAELMVATKGLQLESN